MKFVFRLATLLKQRKIEQDMAQRRYSEAQDAVSKQLLFIKKLYNESDEARLRKENLQKKGISNSHTLNQIEEFIDGNKIRIHKERQKARELMSVAEEKLEILVERVKEYKMVEKLKEKQLKEFKTKKNKKMNAEMDEMNMLRFATKGRV